MSEVAKASKPQLRGLLQSHIKRNIIIAIASCAVAVVAQKYLMNEPRKKVYAEFYKNYDIEKSFETMKSKGLFSSC